MDIADATKVAKQISCCITTKDMKGIFKIMPTDTDAGCIKYHKNGEVEKRWAPTTQDLTRTDWIAVP